MKNMKTLQQIAQPQQYPTIILKPISPTQIWKDTCFGMLPIGMLPIMKYPQKDTKDDVSLIQRMMYDMQVQKFNLNKYIIENNLQLNIKSHYEGARQILDVAYLNNKKKHVNQ